MNRNSKSKFSSHDNRTADQSNILNDLKFRIQKIQQTQVSINSFNSPFPDQKDIYDTKKTPLKTPKGEIKKFSLSKNKRQKSVTKKQIMILDKDLIKIKTQPTDESEFNLMFTPLFSSDNQNEIINRDIEPYSNEFPKV